MCAAASSLGTEPQRSNRQTATAPRHERPAAEEDDSSTHSSRPHGAATSSNLSDMRRVRSLKWRIWAAVTACLAATYVGGSTVAHAAWLGIALIGVGGFFAGMEHWHRRHRKVA